MTLRRILYLFVLAVGIAWCVPAQIAHADVNDFTITRFNADYTLSNDDKQGRLRIVEQIDVLFTDNNHGILRAIPHSYKNHRLQLVVANISSKTGAPTEYTTYQSNGNTVLKIGDPDKTVTGQQSYTIDYTLHNVVSFYEGHDELFWDINGNQWGQKANEVALTLRLPKDLALSLQQPKCYTGSNNSAASNCVVRYNDDTHEIAVTTTGVLYPYQTLSVVAGFEKGYFTPSTWRDTLGEYAGMIWSFTIPFALLAGSAAALWFRRGRDAKGRGVIVPQYDGPKDLGPLEAGTLVDFKTDNRDITATIIDLAVRRYITIVEEKKVRKFRKDLLTYTIKVENSDTSKLNSYERKLLKDMLASATGNEVALETLKYKLAQTAQTVRKDARESLTKRGYLRPVPSFLFSIGIFGLVVIGLIIAGVLLANLHASAAFVSGTVLGIMVAGIFLALLPSRTAKGVEAKEHILGLKFYLETAEAGRLQKLQSPDAPYAATPAPKRTVELFEKLLPYAMALGVERAWAKQFEHIYTTPPDWYSGHWTAFNAGYLASSLSGGVSSAVNTAFSASSSSSGSGFSGGGAGGGGGGGGGGGW